MGDTIAWNNQQTEGSDSTRCFESILSNVEGCTQNER